MALTVPIVADTSGLVRGLNKGQSSLRRFGKIAAFAAGAAAFGGLVKTLDVGVKKFVEQDKAIRQTNARLESTGGIANVTAEGIVKLSDAIADKTGIDDDAIHAMGNMLLTFTNIRNEVGKNNDIFDQAVQITTDLSVAFEKDLNTSAIMVGKALNDPIKGVTALGRAGVQFTEQQKEQIKALVETGRTLEAQKMILRELETQVGGSAEAFGKTLPGQLSILRQAFDNVALDLANKLIPRIFDATKRVTRFLNEFKAQPTLTARVRFVIGTFAGSIWRGVSTINDWWSKPKVQFEDNPANRLKVDIQPPARARIQSTFDRIYEQSAPASNEAGRRLGVILARGLFTGLDNESGKRGPIFRTRFIKIFTGIALVERGIALAKGLWEGFTTEMDRLGKSWPDVINRILSFYNPFGIGENLGKLYRQGVEKGARGRRGTIKKIITQEMRDAIQSARRDLQGLGDTLTGFLNRLVGEDSPEAKRLAAIRKQQKEEAAAREEAALRQKIAEAETDEERIEAQRDLDDFLLDQEAQRLEESINQQQDANERAIDDLIESFNRGEMSAEQFSAALDGIIGANRGAELGIGFAGAFGRAIEDLLASVRDIFGIVGQDVPIASGGTGPVTAAAEQAYKDALEDWKKRRDSRRKQATDFRKREASDGGEKITAKEKKEIEEIMAAWNRRNPRPQRAAYGLALGGILKKTVFAAGEMGPEAVIPLQSQGAWNMLRDAAMASGGNAGGGGDIYLTVNAGLGTNPDELSRVIVDSIKRYERRNGSVFSGPLVTSTGNAAGVQSTDSGAADFNFIRLARRG